MQLIGKTLNIDFMGKRRLAVIVSLIVIAVCISSFVTRQMNLGLDFTGGTLIELGYPESVEISQVRNALAESGFGEAVVQHFGTSRDILIRIAPRANASKAELSNNIIDLLQQAGGGNLKMRRVEFVGPQIGDELREQGGLAMLFALVGILIYVAFRFEYRFAIGSVVALVHDVLITLGFFSITGLEFDLTVLAALLAVIGYSLNDTIVVYDRIRENFRKVRKGMPIDIVNASLNQTLSRTLITSLTTLLVLTALFIYGGELIHGFATALIVGVFVGTYSSIFVASPITLALGISKADMMAVKKEGAEPERSP